MKRFRLLSLPRILTILGIYAGGVLLDQITKKLAAAFLKKVPTVPLWEGVLHLTYVENRGAAFGMMADSRWIFLLVSTAAILGLTAYLFLGFGSDRLSEIGLSMIVSGGIGNMIDRLTLGYVVDFIDFRLINFAVFNGADSFVCVGAGLVILSLILGIRKEAAASKNK